MTDDIVTRSQQHGTHHEKTGTDEEYIQHLELKLHKTNDEIERLREALTGVCYAPDHGGGGLQGVGVPDPNASAQRGEASSTSNTYTEQEDHDL